MKEREGKSKKPSKYFSFLKSVLEQKKKSKAEKKMNNYEEEDELIPPTITPTRSQPPPTKTNADSHRRPTKWPKPLLILKGGGSYLGKEKQAANEKENQSEQQVEDKDDAQTKLFNEEDNAGEVAQPDGSWTDIEEEMSSTFTEVGGNDESKPSLGQNNEDGDALMENHGVAVSDDIGNHVEFNDTDQLYDSYGYKFLEKIDRDFAESPRLIMRGIWRGKYSEVFFFRVLYLFRVFSSEDACPV